MNAQIYAILISLLLSVGSPGAEKPKDIPVPDWLHSGEGVAAERVTQKDDPYLAQWLDRNARPAPEYVVRLFDTYQVVILGEEHNVKEHKDFVIDLIPRLYREAHVRWIGWEFSPDSKNERLEKLVSAPKYDAEAVLQFARDCNPGWNSREHWDIIKAVWQVNHARKPDDEKMHLIGLPHDLDVARMYIVARTKPVDSPEFQEVLDENIRYDRTMAQTAAEHIVRKGHKGLLFVGLGHDWTRYQYPPEAAFGRTYKTMGGLLKEKWADRVFQIRLRSSADPAFLDRVMRQRDHEWIGFDMDASPFAGILLPVGRGAPDVPWSRLASGLVYLGPPARLHKNTAIDGFVTDAMFQKYKHYYEVNYDRRFHSAEEVDEYLQQHRWPSPR
ncbi:MAG: hypothetical protein JW741_03430 [Sedimentisphaerales bacterium]|nr:hypothetical protein [Sedimentisphaerales bacterium]